MEQVGKLLNNRNASQLVRSSDSKTISVRSSEPLVPQWAGILMQMAQDKRHELAPGMARYWREKMIDYSDKEISDALMLYTGEFFPSVDQIIATMDRKRDYQATNKGWEEYKQAQRKAAAEGRLATQEERDALREVFRKIAEAPVEFTHKGKAAPALAEIDNAMLVKSVEAAKKFIASNPDAKAAYKQMQRDTRRHRRDAGSVFKG